MVEVEGAHGSLKRSAIIATHNIRFSLEADGVVRRAEHPSDRRAFLVDLTTQGQPTVAKLEADMGTLAHALFGDLSDPELKLFRRVLDQLADRLSAAAGAEL